MEQQPVLVSMGQVQQDQLIKWVVVPGITVGAMVLVTAIFRRRSKRRKARRR